MDNEKDKLMRYDDSHSIFGMILAVIGQTVLTILLSLVFSLFLTAFVTIFFPNADISKSVANIYEAFDLGIVIQILGDCLLVLVYFFLMGAFNFKRILKGFKNGKLILYSIIGGVVLTCFTIIYSAITIKIGGVSDNANQSEAVSLIHSNWVLGFLLIAICAPIVEELGFRYFIFGSLKSKSRATAYIVSALVFAAVHFAVLIGSKDINWVNEAVSLPTYLAAGLLFCFAYDKSGRLACPIIMHATNNIIAFVLMFL